MKVLVINCGSSSLKYQVLDMTNENLLCKGLVERIGMDGSVIGHEKIGQEKIKTEVPMKDHKDAIAQVLAAIQDPEHGVVKSMADLGAAGPQSRCSGCCGRRWRQSSGTRRWSLCRPAHPSGDRRSQRPSGRSGSGCWWCRRTRCPRCPHRS